MSKVSAMRRPGPVRLLSLVILVVGCAEPAPAPTEGTEIRVGDDFFLSNHEVVFPDEPVTWRWTGSHQHDVTFDDASLGASPTQASGTYTKTFAAAQSGDTFTYYCTVHGRAVMSGIIAIR
jgi:plastocyanin